MRIVEISTGTKEQDVLAELVELLTNKLFCRIATPPCLAVRFYSALGKTLELFGRISGRKSERYLGPDGMIIIGRGIPVLGNIATTLGEYVHLLEDYTPANQRFLLNHEYVHVLQYRAMGWSFLPKYMIERFKARWKHQDPYLDNPLEAQALRIEAVLQQHPWLPDIWELEQPI